MAPKRRPRWMKDMRIPCDPRIQSMASVQGSNEPRRVREHEREGRREAGIGLKRVSSKALD